MGWDRSEKVGWCGASDGMGEWQAARRRATDRGTAADEADSEICARSRDLISAYGLRASIPARSAESWAMSDRPLKITFAEGRSDRQAKGELGRHA